MKDTERLALDAWIAEHVMGFVWARDTTEHRSDNPRGSKFKKGHRCLVKSLSKVCGWVKARSNEPLAPAWNYDVPRYTSPHGTFTEQGGTPLDVLEQCVRRAGCEIEIDAKRTNDGPIRIECGPMRTRIVAIHEEFPVAICLFAKQLFTK